MSLCSLHRSLADPRLNLKAHFTRILKLVRIRADARDYLMSFREFTHSFIHVVDDWAHSQATLNRRFTSPPHARRISTHLRIYATPTDMIPQKLTLITFHRPTQTPLNTISSIPHVSHASISSSLPVTISAVTVGLLLLILCSVRTSVVTTTRSCTT